MDLATGQVFGRYTIERALGEGGMGRVYRASDTKLLRRVALKVLHSADDDEGAALILREARAAAAIQGSVVKQALLRCSNSPSACT